MLKRNKHWNAFKAWLYEKQLGSLGDFPLPEMLLTCQICFIFLCLYDQGGWNGMNKNRYKHFRQHVETKIMQMRMYQFKLTKNLFLSRVYKHVSSVARWNSLYRHRNITEPDHLSGYFFNINTQLLCHHKKSSYVSYTFSVLS